MRTTHARLLACLLAAAVSPATVVAAETYRWLDEQGTPHESQRPPEHPPGNVIREDRGRQDCAARWAAYQRSQACFERFRTAEAGLKPEAFEVCGPELLDPSPDCGPAP